MHVRVMAYGDLRRYLPQNERDSGALTELAAAATVTQMLDVLRLPYHSAWLIGVNDEIVGLEYALQDGDRIELMLQIGGGRCGREGVPGHQCVQQAI
jgi:sulfur carrier protein ThiS